MIAYQFPLFTELFLNGKPNLQINDKAGVNFIPHINSALLYTALVIISNTFPFLETVRQRQEKGIIHM